jgi:hypothetical protein
MSFENSRSGPNDLHPASFVSLAGKAVPSLWQINDSSIEFGSYFRDMEENMRITVSQFFNLVIVN